MEHGPEGQKKISRNGRKCASGFCSFVFLLCMFWVFCTLEKVIEEMRRSVLLLGGKGMFIDKVQRELKYKGRKWLCNSNAQ